MNDKDTEYLANYKKDTLYVNPGKDGAYATLVSEGEELVGEVNVTSRFKLAVSVFYVNQKRDFGRIKLTKLKYHALRGWREDGSIQINQFQTAQLNEFISILTSLDLAEAKKSKIGLGNITTQSLTALLRTEQAGQFLDAISEAPTLTQDIFALAAKRRVVEEFETKLRDGASESDWQQFFETNPWIFGFGIHHVFLDKVGEKWQQQTTGHEIFQDGKIADALARTRAEISQTVFIEIKKSDTPLLKSREYRSGCWAISDELCGAVAQTQKTVFEFEKRHFRIAPKDKNGNEVGDEFYSIRPRSFVVIGSLKQLAGSDNKITCFELFRRETKSPEIVTYDELYYRTKYLVENLGKRENS